MDYKFTFEDGSEAYLEHHGVKGMKWGIRKKQDTITKTRDGMESEGGGGGFEEDEDLKDDISKLDNDPHLHNDSLESFKDFGRFLQLTNGNVPEAMERLRQYNLGIDSVRNNTDIMKDWSRAQVKLALEENEMNPEWTKEQAVAYIEKEFEGVDKAKLDATCKKEGVRNPYTSTLALANAFPSEAQRTQSKLEAQHERKTVADYKKNGAKSLKSDIKEIQNEWSSDKTVDRVKGVAKNSANAVKLAKKAGITAKDMKKEDASSKKAENNLKKTKAAKSAEKEAKANGKAKVSRIVGASGKTSSNDTGLATKTATAAKAANTVAKATGASKKSDNSGLATKTANAAKSVNATKEALSKMDASQSDLDKFLTKLRTTSR